MKGPRSDWRRVGQCVAGTGKDVDRLRFRVKMINSLDGQATREITRAPSRCLEECSGWLEFARRFFDFRKLKPGRAAGLRRGSINFRDRKGRVSAFDRFRSFRSNTTRAGRDDETSLVTSVPWRSKEYDLHRDEDERTRGRALTRKEGGGRRKSRRKPMEP